MKPGAYQFTLIVLVLCIGCGANGASAEAGYPTRPIRLLVGFAPGGATDIVARAIAPKLDDALRQRLVIDNRAGASQIIAADLAARAAPDGYTLLMASAGFTINPAFYQKLPFDVVRDFSAIAMVASAPNVLVVHPAIPAKSVKELIALARAKPGQLTYGSAGVGAPSHLSGVLFGTLAGVEITHVPYKGSGQVMIDLLGGQLQMSFPALSGATPHIKSNKLIALGITTRKRSALMPELPTIAESAIPGFEASSWFGMIGPAGMPKNIVNKLNEAVNRILKEPDVRDTLARQGTDVVGGSPEDFATTILTEVAKWKKLAASARIKPE